MLKLWWHQVVIHNESNSVPPHHLKSAICNIYICIYISACSMIRYLWYSQVNTVVADGTYQYLTPGLLLSWTLKKLRINVVNKNATTSSPLHSHDHHGFSNNWQSSGCLFNSLITVKETTSKVHIAGPLWGESNGDRWFSLIKGQ